MRRPRPLPDLDWAPARAHAFGSALLDVWTSYLEALPDLPVGARETPEEVRAAVSRPVPDQPWSDSEMVGFLRELALRHGAQVGHGGFMAYISGAGTVPGAPAALLAAGLNQNLGGWPLGPGATELETHLLDWFAQRLGLDGASGAFVAGGATANFVALAVARDARAGWDVRTEGMRAGPPLAMYASSDVHETVDRAADLLGLGAGAVRRIGVDERFRVRPDAVAEAIAADVAAGVRPLCVVGTAGSTEFGAIDPLDALADVAAEHDCWFHVDAAYGGPAAMVDALRPRFRGIERADSLTCDPHKWLNTPISSSLVLIRDPALQEAAFTLEPDYTRQSAELGAATMRYQWTPQFTRPFDALPVWVSLCAHGWDAYQRRIAHDVELARWLHHLVSEHPELEPLHDPELSVVCFRYVPPGWGSDGEEPGVLDELNEEILYGMQAAGRVFPSNAVVDGRYALRACLIGYRTEADDVEALVEQTVALGRERYARRRRPA